MAGGFGARTAIAEERYLGGTCVNVGCIPKKLFVYASHFSEDFHDARGFGWTVGDAAFDWTTLISNKDSEISRLNGIYERLLAGAGVEIFNGRARIVDANTVEIDHRQISAKRILVATGGWPSVPEFPGNAYAITSNDAFHLKRLPERIMIVGGGYIAVEFAGIFNGLGVETTQLYRGPLFLRGFDHDLREFLAGEMGKKGVNLRFDINVTGIAKTGDEFDVSLTDGTREKTDLVMFATGRVPNTGDLGLAEAGVELNEEGAVIVDGHYQSTVSSIYALGDVTDRVNLTPVALAEGMAFARHVYGGGTLAVDYDYIPTAVFSQPNLGTVGLTEEQARARYQELAIFKSSYTPLKHTLTGSNEKTLMKLLVDVPTQRVVGVHMVGPDAGEIIQGMAIALRAGATKETFDTTIGIHPTAAEEFVTMRDPVTD